MRPYVRRIAMYLSLLTLISTSFLIAADKKNDKKKRNAKTPAVPQMDESKRALHVLNRFTFGPRPGDVERVSAMGVDKWFDQQLHPEKIDDSALDTRLAGFRTLNMNARQLMEAFPPNQVIKQIADGRRNMPNDPEKRAVYESAVDRYEQKQEVKADGGKKGTLTVGTDNPDVQANNEDKMDPAAADKTTSDARAAQQERRREGRREAMSDVDRLTAMTPDQRYETILKMEPDERRVLVAGMQQDERQRLFADFTPQQREMLQATINPQSVIVNELQQAKLLRAAYSDRQLEEVMDDFWFNHFNVYLNKGQPEHYLLDEYERDVIRPHALGKFKDLLVATAKSPAMMFYLDNWQSVGPHSQAAENERRGGNRPFRPNAQRPFGGPPRPNRGVFNQQQRFPQDQNGDTRAQQKTPQQQAQKRGLNENYGRELMELHTLGVDGGYTQADVTEAAKVFTGWTIQQPRQGGGFMYNARMHEPGTKHLLGAEIKDDGEDEGMKLLDILAHHPATAHFISKKLAMRFVSDTPPQSLVDRMAATFIQSDGDIREVLRTMFQSPEFWSPEAYRAKVKTPLEFVVSAIRASDADVQNAQVMVGTLNQLGMPLYQMQPPTGYSMKAESWVNSGALLNRMNFALRLGSGRMQGVNFDVARLFGAGDPATYKDDAPRELALLENSLLAGDISRQTHDAILKQVADPQLLARKIDASAASADDMGQNAQPAAAPVVPRPPQPGVLAGLILGSPEFQRR